MYKKAENILQKNDSSNNNKIYKLIDEFNFLESTESDYGELVHNIVDQLGIEITNNEKVFEILKKKLTILDNGTLNILNLQKNSKVDIKDIIVSEETYFDCRASLKKELKRISQNAKLNSQILQPKDISLIKHVFSYHPMFNDKNDVKYPQDYDVFVIKHPSSELNGCRTFALRKKNIPSDSSNESNNAEFIPISYVSCVNKIDTKWEQYGKRIINIMYSIVNMIPRDIKFYITILQDIYPISQKNSIDSYVLYVRLLFYAIKLVPSSLSILIRFLFNKLVSIESEIHTKNPNNFTKERFEKWRQEELQIVALKIRRGEYKDINAAKQYIQDTKGLRNKFSELFVEEDIDRNAQIIDNITVELFEFIDEICESCSKYSEILEKINRESPKSSPTKINNFQKQKTTLLSSSDLESSAAEENWVSTYGKREEQFFRQYIDLESTILNIFETQMLTIENCQFVNYIPIYFICHNDGWCEKFLQINFKKLFNPHETLYIRKTSVDYIISFIVNYKNVSNFKFFTPCIKYFMQFLREFVAHWNVERANQAQNNNQYSSKKFSCRSKINKNLKKQVNKSLKNLFGLYCHVVQSLCDLFSMVLFIVEELQIFSIENLDFLAESIFNIKRGFISFIICGDLTPLDNIETESLVNFVKFSLQLLEKMKDLSYETHIAKYFDSIKLAKELLDLFNLNEDNANISSRSFLEKMFLLHSEKYMKKLYSNNIIMMNGFKFSYEIDKLLDIAENQRHQIEDNQPQNDQINKYYSESTQIIDNQVELTQTKNNQFDSAKNIDNQVESTQTKDDQFQSTQAKHNRFDSAQMIDNQIESTQTKDDQFQSTQSEHNQFGSAQMIDNQIGSIQTKDDQFQSTQAKHNQFDSAQMIDNQIGLTQTKDDQFQSTQSEHNQFGSSQTKDGQFDSAQITDNQIGSTQTKHNQFDSAKNIDNQVESTQIKDNRFDSDKNIDNQFQSTRTKDDQFDSAQITDNQIGSTQTKHNQFDSAKNMDNQVESTQTKHYQFQSTQNKHNQFESAQIIDNQVESAIIKNDKIESTQFKNNQVNLIQTENNRLDLDRNLGNQVDSTQTENNRIHSNQIETNKIYLDKIEDTRGELNQNECNRIYLNQNDHNQIESTRIEDVQMEIKQYEGNQIENIKIDNKTVESNRIENNKVGNNQFVKTVIENNSNENVYGKMESSILPEQSLWEYVWGDLPVSQEELEKELYVTKNQAFKLEFEELNSENIKKSKKLRVENSSKNLQLSNRSLLDTLLSSEAYKRSEINMYNFRRKNMILKKKHRFRNLRLI